jgi:hypothetical protein
MSVCSYIETIMEGGAGPLSICLHDEDKGDARHQHERACSESHAAAGPCAVAAAAVAATSAGVPSVTPTVGAAASGAAASGGVARGDGAAAGAAAGGGVAARRSCAGAPPEVLQGALGAPAAHVERGAAVGGGFRGEVGAVNVERGAVVARLALVAGRQHARVVLDLDLARLDGGHVGPVPHRHAHVAGLARRIGRVLDAHAHRLDPRPGVVVRHGELVVGAHPVRGAVRLHLAREGVRPAAAREARTLQRVLRQRAGFRERLEAPEVVVAVLTTLLLHVGVQHTPRGVRLVLDVGKRQGAAGRPRQGAARHSQGEEQDREALRGRHINSDLSK